MRGLAGYSFKEGKLTDQQRQMLNDYLLAFEDNYGTSELTSKNRTYLFRQKHASLSIMGIGPPNGEKSHGIIWGSSEYNILQVLAHVMPEADMYPYKVEENAIYFVEDGEVYFMFRKGMRVRTPEGSGKIFLIDDIHDICVELDREPSINSPAPSRAGDDDIVYEYTVQELEKEV